ncbi:hypothetical protein [Haladaptatus salinisoli]|nr:hypothetical protein [Haladaptatus salinisoli]
MSDRQVSERQVNDRPEDDHLDDVPDGSGCTEIWEHLSERRGEDETREE